MLTLCWSKFIFAIDIWGEKKGLYNRNVTLINRTELK